nr:hypothetical protein [Serratia quinivorans]
MQLNTISQRPISIAPMLWNHQTGHALDITITHGKGRKGIVIRTRRTSRWISSINLVLRGLSK